VHYLLKRLIQRMKLADKVQLANRQENGFDDRLCFLHDQRFQTFLIKRSADGCQVDKNFNDLNRDRS
jgi:hypothetical protein